MKHSSQILSSLCLSFVTLGAVTAGTADLADLPLVNATTASVLPNIAFILDDSGSMDDENMPDDHDTNKSSYCWKWYGYNSLYYNPTTTYLPPKKADGSRFPNASFSAALKDGYFASTAKMYDGSSDNGTTNLAALSSGASVQSNVVFSSLDGSKYKVTSVVVTLLDGTSLQLLNGGPTDVPSGGTTFTDTLGAAVRDSINAKTSTGFTAAYNADSNTLTITAPASQAGLATTPTVTRTRVSGSNRSITVGAFAKIISNVYYSTHTSNPSSTTCAANSDYSIVGLSSDIAAPGVTTGSAEAQTNYANWYSYYRKRAFMAKAAAGEAFSSLDEGKYRVGLFYINSIESGYGTSASNNDLAIDTFSGTGTGTHRANWFNRLYATRSGGWTPLRSALSRAGRMFGGKISGWDPVQFSCQRNFSILTTDGYWNDGYTNSWVTVPSDYKKLDGSTNVGDQDGVSVVTRPSLDSSAIANTLADVAYYYYHTDLRPNACTSPDVCTNNVPPAGSNANVDDVASHQHMTTFTIGLGVSGTLVFQEGYKNSTSGDYFSIVQGSGKNWPNPNDGDKQKIDDLWHAAVNGRGTYFSAKNAATFAAGIQTALGAIEASSGSGAAAATSNLQPTAGDNFTYIASYRTVNWDGELSAKSIDLSTGAISTTTSWQAGTLLSNKIAAAGDSDTRTIKTWDSAGADKIKNFLWANLSTAEKAYFDNTKLSQYLSDWSATDKTNATGEALVNYLRGQDRYENQARDSAYGAYYRLYRDREKILGDIVHAQPVYVKTPSYDFLDEGYAAFKVTQASRAGVVYVAANDGMLHAFDATAGTENWAYIPPLQLKDMWRLADENYASHHRYYLDGPIAVTDIKDGSSWKTVLVGAMGKGGRGIYALDITSSSSPKALWNFTADDNANLGYTYGAPMISKLADGTWVVVVASGYNNVPEGSSYAAADGIGRLFVLNAATGALIKTISTNVGTVGTPSGLGTVNLKVNDFQQDNTAVAAYGGDLLGNLWRFNLDAGTSSKVVALGSNQPITVAPEVGEVEGKTVLFFGTGRYLGEDDLSSNDTQSFYAIKDDGTKTVVLGTDMVKMTMDSSSSRNITGTAVDWSTQYGWYLDLPGGGERVHLGAQLFFGSVVFSSLVPTNTECQPGGYGYRYVVDYATGLRVSGATQNVWAYTSPLVGITVAKLPSGTVKVYPINANGGTPSAETLPISSGGGSGSDSGTRVMWRELIN